MNRVLADMKINEPHNGTLNMQAYRIYPVRKVMRIFGHWYQIPGLIGLLWWQADGYCDLMHEKQHLGWVADLYT